MSDAVARRPLRVLYIEDDSAFTVLVRRILERDGFAPAVTRVESEAELAAALEREVFDVVLSDQGLPGFNTSDAVRMIRSRRGDLPVIILSGSVVEERFASMKSAEVSAFVPKSSLATLGAAIRRVLAE